MSPRIQHRQRAHWHADCWTTTDKPSPVGRRSTNPPSWMVVGHHDLDCRYDQYLPRRRSSRCSDAPGRHPGRCRPAHDTCWNSSRRCKTTRPASPRSPPPSTKRVRFDARKDGRRAQQARDNIGAVAATDIGDVATDFVAIFNAPGVSESLIRATKSRHSPPASARDQRLIRPDHPGLARARVFGYGGRARSNCAPPSTLPR